MLGGGIFGGGMPHCREGGAAAEPAGESGGAGAAVCWGVCDGGGACVLGWDAPG